MKLFTRVQLNSLGLSTVEKKVALAIRLLIGGTMPNKTKATLKAEIKAVAAKAAVIGVPEQLAQAVGSITPAKAAIAAKAAVGTLGQPGYQSAVLAQAAVAPVPAVAIPYKAAVLAVPAVTAVTAVAAVYANIYAPLPEFMGSVMIDPSNAAYDKVNLVLPYSPAAIALGLPLDVKQIQEITPANAYLGDWQGDLTGVTPTTEPDFVVGNAPGTVEQFLYFYAKQLPAMAGTTNKINTALYRPTPTAPAIPVISMELYLGKSFLG